MYIRESEFYSVGDSFDMCRLPDRFKTYGEAIEAMDATKRRETEAGYPPVDYIITKTTWKTVFDDKGRFYSRTEQTLRIEP